MKFNFKKSETIGREVYPLLKNHKLLEEDPNDRIKKHFTRYIPRHCYSVCRSNYWKIAISEACYKEYSFFGSTENHFEFLITFSNKSIAIPELMWLRSDENTSIRGTSPSLTTGYTVIDWWNDEKYKNEKKEYINRIELACKKISKLNKKSYQPDVKAGLEFYINYFKYEHPKLFKNNFFLFYPLNQLYYIFKKLPNYIKQPILSVWRIFGVKIHKLNELPFFDQLKVLEKEGVKIDYKELKFIEKEIRKFHFNK
jgi:hypothetical protein